MNVAMSSDDAKAWFGVIPPDLSVEARVRGSDWLYNYFLAFYRDDTPTGWNNLVFPNVGMPHVAWQLSGTNVVKTATFDSHEKAVAAVIAIKGLTQIEPGAGGKWIVKSDRRQSRCARHADAGPVPDVGRRPRQLLDYMAEPDKNKRITLGIIVLMYLGRALPAGVRAEALLLEGRSLARRPRKPARGTGGRSCPVALERCPGAVRDSKLQARQD